MTAWMVLCTYVPHEGKEEDLLQLLEDHIPTLRRLDLATDRAGWVMLSQDGDSIHELFEWASEEAARAAESNEEVQAIWSAMAEVCEFTPMAKASVGQGPFAHFQVIDS